MSDTIWRLDPTHPLLATRWREHPQRGLALGLALLGLGAVRRRRS